MREKILSLRNEFETDLLSINSQKQLEEIRLKFFSRKGNLSFLFEELKNVSKEEKPELGKLLNQTKLELEARFEKLKIQLELTQSNSEKFIDLSMPGKVVPIGSKHILTQTLDEIKSIFMGLGFSVYAGPELESDFNNFEALNFPANHPARDEQDTYFINEKFLLRTHTSPVQIRTMLQMEPPIRAIMPGKVFRNEAISARSHCQFHQVEGLYVDKNVTFAELKGTLVAYAKQFYGSSLKYRFRSSFFPFTEPSAEMDITCYLCQGKGCRICKHTGWLEILGCGMVDPNVLKAVNIDPEEYTGYAFGMGIERTGLLKYDIPDIRYYFENDNRFLSQF